MIVLPYPFFYIFRGSNIVSIQLQAVKYIYKILHIRKGSHLDSPLWELLGSNQRPSACKADALNQLS